LAHWIVAVGAGADVIIGTMLLGALRARSAFGGQSQPRCSMRSQGRFCARISGTSPWGRS
jgi:hypothetical protein